MKKSFDIDRLITDTEESELSMLEFYVVVQPDIWLLWGDQNQDDALHSINTKKWLIYVVHSHLIMEEYELNTSLSLFFMFIRKGDNESVSM
jgi:hypothetical protein